MAPRGRCDLGRHTTLLEKAVSSKRRQWQGMRNKGRLHQNLQECLLRTSVPKGHVENRDKAMAVTI